MRRFAILLWLPALAAAQSAGEDSQKQVSAYLERAARAITDRAEAEIASGTSWEQVRQRRLEEMRDMLGLLPWPRRTPLHARITGKIDQGSYSIEKVAFESFPKIYVTANLYLPNKRKGPAPAIVYVCGHSLSPYGAKTQYQRHGISFARNGYIAFVLDPIQIAETFALHHGVSSQEMYDWYARGYTPAAVETWNAMRAIDYLETRAEVDKERIGMTGRSGGAAISWFTAAVDPRIKVVSPVMGISTYAANVRENTQRLHCDCMFVINSYLHDMIHQGALIAPRPLLMMHGRLDNLFPEAGYTEFQEKVGALYRAYGQPDAFGNVVVETKHADSDYLREQAIRWFDRYLLKIPDRPLDMTYTNLPDPELAVFPDGPPTDAQNYRVHETFTTRPPSPKYPTLAAWEARRRELLDLLRRKVFVAPLEPLPVRTILRKASGSRALLYVASDGEDPRFLNDLLGPVRATRLVLYPRGVGEIPWDKSFWKATLRNAMHVGHTVDSMRLADVLSGVEMLRKGGAAEIMVLGKGVSGALGLYAAILDERIAQVMLMDPPSSHVQGPVFLNILRYTDLPEAAGLIAPRRLNFYARVPDAYEYTRHIYQLYGKPDHLFLAMNIDRVLEGRYDHNFSSGR